MATKIPFGPIIAAAIAIGLPAASREASIVHSPSGVPEATFTATTPTEVSGLIAGRCADRAMVLVRAEPSTVVCQAPMKAAGQMFNDFLFGSRGSTPTEYLYTFTLFQVGPNVRVQGRAAVETTSAYGQRRSVPMDSTAVKNNIQAMLNDLSGAPPSDD